MKYLIRWIIILLVLALAGCTATPDSMPVDAQPPTAASSSPQPATPPATNAPPVPPQPLTATPDGALYALPLYNPINLRSGPGTSYAIVGYAQTGDRLLVLGRSPDHDWIKVAYAPAPQGVAWVFNTLVALDGNSQP